MKKWYTKTENNAIQWSSSGNFCLDLFSTIGSSQEMAKQEPQILLQKFWQAFIENPAQALTILFWTRAIREGAGQRNIFQTILADILKPEQPVIYKSFIISNLEALVQLGRWKDLVWVFDNCNGHLSMIEVIVNMFTNAIKEKDALACKWLPKRHKLHTLVQKQLGFTNKQLRKHLAKYANTVEQKMCAKEWNSIEVSKIPSQAFNNYKKTFFKHMGFDNVMKDIIENGVNTGAIYPHEIIHTLSKNRSSEINKISTIQWDNLENFIPDGMTFLPVCDVSGSMECLVGKYTAMNIAISLSMYCAERLSGVYKNKFITFSSDPQIQSVKGETLFEKCSNLYNADWGMTTDIVKVFKLILKQALVSLNPQNDIPKMVIIFSDMQFDDGVRYDITLMDAIRLKFKEYNIPMPSVVYWNLYDTNTGFIDSQYDNVAMVSGFNPKLLKAIFEGSEYKHNAIKTSPIDVMHKALEPIANKLDLSLTDSMEASIIPAMKNVYLNESVGTSIREKPVSDINNIDNEEW